MARKAKTSNISLVAKKAKASIATVSRVINNHPDVSEELRQRVMAAVADTGFSPDKASEKVFRISVIVGVGDITDYIATILTGIEIAANEENIDISIQRCTGRVPLLRLCRTWRSDAVIIISGERMLNELPSIAKAGIPCMLVNRKYEGFHNIGYIHNESANATKQALQYLYAQGHRKIAYLAAEPMTSVSYTERITAYQEFMKSENLQNETVLVKPYPIGHIDGLGRDKEAGYHQTMQVLGKNPETTAFICANDEIALGAYRACADKGLKIPEDISIIGCDDQSFARFLCPALTTIRLQMTQTGKRTVHTLADFLRGNLESLPCEQLQSELVVRGSVMPVTRA